MIKKLLRILFYILLLLGIILVFKNCQSVRDSFFPPAPRELYARSFSDNEINFINWNLAFERAKQDSLQVTLPFEFNGQMMNSRSAIQFDFQMHEGRKYTLDISNVDTHALFFVDLYKLNSGSLNNVSESQYQGMPIPLEIRNSGDFRLVVQKNLGPPSPINIIIYSEARLAFPVAGKDNRAIQSFWGAPRDGGKRRHEGIDIFAKRGTPILAGTNGWVSYAGSKGRGGKQVWLRSSELRKSIYYAHLDSILVSKGTAVIKGDTIGHVGNTGNAKSTPPHLHLGIYGLLGAMNPLPFIETQEKPKPVFRTIPFRGNIISKNSNIRIGPNKDFPQLTDFKPEGVMLIIGQVGNWFQIKNDEQQTGYIYKSLLKTD